MNDTFLGDDVVVVVVGLLLLSAPVVWVRSIIMVVAPVAVSHGSARPLPSKILLPEEEEEE